MSDSPLGIAVTVGLSILSLYTGMAVAGAQQDRDAMRKQRGVAKALLAELDRIDDELERRKDTGLVPWTGKPPVPPPEIHRWIEGLIAQIADEAPDVVAGFMRLEVALALLAQTADRARESYLALRQTHENFERLERERREQFDRGTYDPTTDRFLPHGATETYEDLPDDVFTLTALASVDATLKSRAAAAKLAWTEAREKVAKDTDEYHWEPVKVMSIIMRLKERLYVIARRAVPALTNLVFKSAIPVHEDVQLAKLADEAALSEIRFGQRQFGQVQKSV